MSGQNSYRAFISYSHHDKSWGEWLHRQLETYRLPKAIVGRDTPFGPIPERLAPIFRDRDELATATDLSTEITGALENSMFLVVVCSPAAATSRWVNEEIKTFKRLHGDDRVRAIIVEGKPFSGDAATECFPEALRLRVGHDGEMTAQTAEPIAADLRAEGDGKKYAVSKLVAGLTGARLDELIRREQQRRSARMRLLAAGLGVLVLVLSGLTFDALRQRNAARAAQADAEFQRNEAQNLVEYMLTDLRDKLNAVGRLDVLESVGQRLAGSYARQDLSKLDADALGRRARVQLLLGEVENTKGSLDKALVRYQEAAATTEELLRRDPGNAQRIFDHAQSVYWVGYIAWQRGDTKTAHRKFTQYYDFAQKLMAIDPDNDDWQMELNYAHSNLGTLAMDQGEADKAESEFRKALEISTLLARERPGDADRVIAQGQAHAWLADALYFQAKLEDAAAQRVAEIALYKNATTRIPDHAAINSSAMIAQYTLSQIALSSNNLDAALRHALDAARQADDSVALDPENTEIAGVASFANAILGESLFYLRRFPESRTALTKAIAISERLSERDAKVVKWKGNSLAQATLVLARLDAAEQDSPAALKRIDEVVRELHAIIDANAANQVMIRRYCAALAARARISSAFDADWREIVARLAPETGMHGPEALSLLAEAYENSGKHADASAIAAKLHAAGYRHPEFLALLAAHPSLGVGRLTASSAARP